MDGGLVVMQNVPQAWDMIPAQRVIEVDARGTDGDDKF